MFQGKVIVITGSVQGIGKRTAELLAKQGAKIVINSRREEKVQQTVDEFIKKGFDTIGFAGDVSDYSFCEKLADETIKQFGRVDYLINNAGLAAKGKLEETVPEVFEKLMSVNILGSIYPTLAFLPHLKEKKGGILFISSLAGIVGLPSYLSYSCTKRSIISIAESLKNELHDDGVYVGVNYPGFTENDSNKQNISPSGESITMKKREDVKVEPLDKTVSKIIRQLEKRKFSSYSSYQGRMVHVIYRYFPSIALAVVKRNRKKIMAMD
jgi:dehydrogenase/reductase SDR family protein 7B